MLPTKLKHKKPIGARDQEKIDIIIVSTCGYFNIERALIKMPGKNCTNVRRICFYLISKNTELSHGQIAECFNMDRSQATRGLDLIAAHRNIYAPTLHQLKDIAEMCNKFEPKNYEWHIQH